MAKRVICPICGQADQVEKVSTIYLIGIGLNKLPPTENPTSKGQIFNPELQRMPTASLRALSRRLAPPSSGKQASFRPIHPDMVVIAFSLIAPLFLYGILTSQPAMFLPVLAILAGFYGLYFWKRKIIIEKFKSQEVSRQSVEGRTKRGIERWMKLYYCIQDDCVFYPGAKEMTPADQMAGFLFKE